MFYFFNNWMVEENIERERGGQKGVVVCGGIVVPIDQMSCMNMKNTRFTYLQTTTRSTLWSTGLTPINRCSFGKSIKPSNREEHFRDYVWVHMYVCKFTCVCRVSQLVIPCFRRPVHTRQIFNQWSTLHVKVLQTIFMSQTSQLKCPREKWRIKPKWMHVTYT